MAGTGSTLVVGGGADGGGDAAGAEAAGEIALDHLAQGVRQHAEFGVDGDEADVIVADADGDGALGDGGVRLFGGVDHQAVGRALGARVGVGGLAARRRWRACCWWKRCRR